MKKFFHVSFVWGGPAKSTETLRPIFDIAEDWLYFGNGNWIIYTDEDIYTWQGRMIAVLGPTDYCFISEITNVYGTAGWLAQSSWDWLRKDRNPISYLMPPSPSNAL
jgi:hypothetical protein